MGLTCQEEISLNANIWELKKIYILQGSAILYIKLSRWLLCLKPSVFFSFLFFSWNNSIIIFSIQDFFFFFHYLEISFSSCFRSCDFFQYQCQEYEGVGMTSQCDLTIQLLYNVGGFSLLTWKCHVRLFGCGRGMQMCRLVKQTDDGTEAGSWQSRTEGTQEPVICSATQQWLSRTSVRALSLCARGTLSISPRLLDSRCLWVCQTTKTLVW